MELVRYIAVDDVGKKINPLIVDGQLHGGIAQGVGQALWERAVYDEDGQLLSGSMLDYALPRASWLPSFELDETVTPSPVNPLGVKGVGEAGAIASTPAVVNAVVDALASAGYPASRHAPHRPAGLARHAREGRPGMIPAAFDYQRPANLEEALRMLARGAEGQGHQRRSEPPAAAEAATGAATAGRHRSAARAPGRQARADGGLVIGAAVTYADVLDRHSWPSGCRCCEVIADIGDVQVRNRGTLGGGVAHADPGSDMPAVILALGGDDRARSLTSKRRCRPRGFFQGAFTTVIAADELLVGLRLPPVPAGAGTAYRQIMQPASGYSMVGVAAVVGGPTAGLIDAHRDHRRRRRRLRCGGRCRCRASFVVLLADISEMADMTPDEAEAFGRLGQHVTELLEALPFPIIACVDGYALGGGCELAMGCDYAYGTERAVFGQPEVTLGLIPGFGGCVRLQRLVGPGRAREMIYTGRRVEAEEARRIGLVNDVFPTRSEMMAAARESIAMIADRSPVAVGVCKAAINGVYGESVTGSIRGRAARVPERLHERRHAGGHAGLSGEAATEISWRVATDSTAVSSPSSWS